MQITVHNDRPAHVTRPDPVAAGEGVFGSEDPPGLSAAEQARHLSATPEALADMPPPPEPQRWSPKAIFDRLTRLYARLTKPGAGVPASQASPDTPPDTPADQKDPR